MKEYLKIAWHCLIRWHSFEVYHSYDDETGVSSTYYCCTCGFDKPDEDNK